MISFFRRALSSWLVLGLLGLIMIAFIVTGVGTGGSGGVGQIAGGSGDTVARVGRDAIGTADVEQRMQTALQAAQREQQGLTMPQFIAGGGFDATLDALLSGTALETFGRRQGLTAAKKLVDGEIASMPAFRGVTGQFDENAMRAVLAQNRVTEAQLRSDVEGNSIRNQLLGPVAAGAVIPESLVMPYASLLLERRQGLIGFIPAAAMAGGSAPTDAEVAAHYRANIAAYTRAPRRALRYAVVGAEQVAAKAQPTDAEIAAAYRRDAAKYAPSERRDVTQVTFPDQAKATAFAAALARGTPLAQAASAAGAAPLEIKDKTKAELADQASPALANAAFAAADKGVTKPAKTDFGWSVARVDRIARLPGKSLAEARPEIVAALSADKAKQALADAAARLDDAIGGGSSFDEVAKAEKLTVQTTPPLFADGRSEQPGYTLPPDLAPVLKQAFEMEADDDPIVATVKPGERFALVAVAQVLPAAPRPLAEVKADVTANLARVKAQARAKAVAEAIVAKASAGTPLAAAMAGSGVKLPPPVPANSRRVDLARSGQKVPPPLALLFSMGKGRTRMLEAPDRGGWYVVTLSDIQRGDARTVPALVTATREQFRQVFGEEYARQFANAARASLGVEVDRSTVNAVKTRLAGGGAADQ